MRDAASKLRVHAAEVEGERRDVSRQLLIALGDALTAWLVDDAALDGLDPILVEAAATDIEATEGWAMWLRTELPANTALRDAMAREIDSAIAAVLHAG